MKNFSIIKACKLCVLCTAALLPLAITEQKAEAADVYVTNVEELTNAISYAGDNASQTEPYTISIQFGTYKLNSAISVPSYTELIFEPDVKISCKTGDYAVNINGASGVVIDGGCFKGSGIFSKGGENVTIKNTTVESAPDCGILVKGDNRQVSIEGNTVKKASRFSVALMGADFKGSIEKNTIIQSEDIGMYFYNSAFKGDISGNTIKNCKKAGLYAGNTPIDGDIKNNTFKNVKGNGIGIYHGSHANAIDGNKMDGIGGNNNGGNGDCGIMINGDEGKGKKATPTYVKSITNNNIKNVTYSGIKLYSGPSGSSDDDKSNQDKTYVKNDIKGNTLYNIGTYKHSKDWKEEIKNGGRYGAQTGIYIDAHARVYGSICQNKITKTNLHGIYMRVGAVAKNISDNTIADVVEHGICINKKAKVTGSIKNNKINNAKTCGICVRESASVNSVSGNSFSKIGYKNVFATDNGKIKKNSN